MLLKYFLENYSFKYCIPKEKKITKSMISALTIKRTNIIKLINKNNEIKKKTIKMRG